MIAFIVLNYNNFSDTKICIDSLLKISKNTSNEIILVDNASTDDSFLQLRDHYNNIEHISFILNDVNYGFSKGNNIGCKYALEHFSVDFLCVINNDTYILDCEFNNKVEEAFGRTLFDILAPCVWNTRKEYNQNPFFCPSNIDEVRAEIKCIKRKARFFKFGAIPYYVASKLFKHRISGKSLSGAACIFSRNYFVRYADVFMEKTFMYDEEAFLYQRIKKDKLKLEYDFDIVIYHSDAKSTQKLYKGKKKKWKFQSEKILQADEVLLEYLSGECDKDL